MRKVLALAVLLSGCGTDPHFDHTSISEVCGVDQIKVNLVRSSQLNANGATLEILVDGRKVGGAIILSGQEYETIQKAMSARGLR